MSVSIEPDLGGGVEVAISLDRGTQLRDGDILLWDEARGTAIVARVDLKEVLIIDLSALLDGPREASMARCVELGHALGNQHWPAVVKGLRYTFFAAGVALAVGYFTWFGQHPELEAQMSWLEEQLASKRAPFTIVAGHHPVYSDAAHGDTAELVKDLGPLLEKHGAHVYLCGHDHDLQHLEIEKLRTSFVLSGGGGARLYKTGEIRKGATVLDVHGFTHLSIAGERMTVRHVDPNGKIVHAFTKGVRHDWKVLA